ncbi:hypothetical protein LTR66_017420 [Elasticomyces elasticus]|nr:hypothetical protein LTR66_017420 [Elasticomyces elasticus]
MVTEKKAELLAGPVCTVLVGSEQQAFSVHKALICGHSLFFDTALNGPWAETSKHTVELPEDEPKIFSLYLHWLYYGNIPVLADRTHLKEMSGDELDTAEDEIVNNEYTQLFKACVLAEKYFDAEFHDTVINAVLEKINTPEEVSENRRPPGSLPVTWLFNHAHILSPICRLVVDDYAKEGSSDWLEDPVTPTDLPATFFRMLSQRLMGKRRASSRWTLRPEDYFYANLSPKRKR